MWQYPRTATKSVHESHGFSVIWHPKRFSIPMQDRTGEMRDDEGLVYLPLHGLDYYISKKARAATRPALADPSPVNLNSLKRKENKNEQEFYCHSRPLHSHFDGLGVFLSTSGVLLGLLISPLSVMAADMSNGADNFYTSDRVTVQKVTFKNQYQMNVAGIYSFPRTSIEMQKIPRSLSGILWVQ